MSEVQYFTVTVKEDDRLNWPKWLVECDGEFMLSTAIQEFEQVADKGECLQVFHDRFQLRLIMAARVETPNSTVIMTRTTEEEMFFWFRFLYALRKTGYLRETSRSRLLFDLFARKIARRNEMRDLSPQLEPEKLPRVSIGGLIASTKVPDRRDLLRSELLCAPFCIASSLALADHLINSLETLLQDSKLKTAPEWGEFQNGVKYRTVILNASDTIDFVDVVVGINDNLPSDVGLGLASILSTFCECERRWIKDALETKTKLSTGVLSRLAAIKYHPEGGVVSLPAWVRAVAMTYTLVAFLGSVAVGVANVAGRDNWFERATDAISTLGLLLFTFIGLVKLSSEDANVIRNAILGKQILRDEGDVVSYMKMGDISELKLALCNPKITAVPWLHSHDCSFVAGQAIGTIRLFGGMTLREFRTTGAVLIGDRAFRSVTDETGSAVAQDGYSVVRINRGERQKVGPDYYLNAVSAMVL